MLKVPEGIILFHRRRLRAREGKTSTLHLKAGHGKAGPDLRESSQPPQDPTLPCEAPLD